MLTDARRPVARNVAFLADQSAGAFGTFEHGIHELQHLLGRAIGGLQRRLLEHRAGALDQLLIDTAFLTQALRPRALERVDRLLFVADGEDGAPRRLGREELARQCTDDLPLFGGGVLGFVDQDVVHAAVQLVQHPGGRGVLGQEPHRARHQVGEVQRAARRLGLFVEGGVGAGERQHLHRVVSDLGRAQDVARRQVFRLQFRQPTDRRRGRRLGAHAGSSVAVRLAEDGGQRRERGVRQSDRVHGVGQLGVGLGAPRHRLGHAAPLAGIDEADEVALDLLRPLVRIGAGQRVWRGCGSCFPGVGIGGQRIAPGLDHRQQGLEPRPVQLDSKVAVGRADRPLRIRQGVAGQILARLVRQQRRRLVLQHREGGRHAGLKRKAPQELFAEGMNGLDLQAARRLQRASEQAARLRQSRFAERGGIAVVQRGHGLGELAIVHHGPAAQLIEQPRLHLGGGGLGVGDAQDGVGPGLGQQQAGHAVDQGGGLARAGVGGDEDRQVRVGGEDLVGGSAHSEASSSPPATAHSHTRARWS